MKKSEEEPELRMSFGKYLYLNVGGLVTLEGRRMVVIERSG